jgi:hypothetical protein
MLLSLKEKIALGGMLVVLSVGIGLRIGLSLLPIDSVTSIEVYTTDPRSNSLPATGPLTIGFRVTYTAEGYRQTAILVGTDPASLNPASNSLLDVRIQVPPNGRITQTISHDRIYWDVVAPYAGTRHVLSGISCWQGERFFCITHQDQPKLHTESLNGPTISPAAATAVLHKQTTPWIVTICVLFVLFFVARFGKHLSHFDLVEHFVASLLRPIVKAAESPLGPSGTLRALRMLLLFGAYVLLLLDLLVLKLLDKLGLFIFIGTLVLGTVAGGFGALPNLVSWLNDLVRRHQRRLVPRQQRFGCCCYSVLPRSYALAM